MERILQQRYRVVRSLGRGGLGAVSLCDDLRLPGKQWAVKQMHNPEPSLQDKFRESFEREAATLSRIRHPNLPVIVDYFEQDGSLYLVMEYVEGENLAEYVRRRGHLAEREVFERGLVLVELLGYLHSQTPPIIFRDLKPENVMLTPDGVLKLVDFGLARRFVPGKRSDTVPSGSVGYAAPEQWEDLSQTDERSDVYSWGATMVHLLTGRIPSPVFPLSALRNLDPALSEAGRAILARCLKARVQDRYPNATALARAITEHLEMIKIWETEGTPPSSPGEEANPPADVLGPHSPRAEPPLSRPADPVPATPRPEPTIRPEPALPLPPERPVRVPSIAGARRAPGGAQRPARAHSPWKRWWRPGNPLASLAGPAILMLVATLAYVQALAMGLPPGVPGADGASGSPAMLASPLVTTRPDLSSGVGPHQIHRNEKTAWARKLYEQGKWADAIGMLDRVTTQFPEDAEAHILRENAYIQFQHLPSVTIPYIGSMSGSDSAEFSSQLHGLALAQYTVNLRGGIRGKKIIIDLYDDESSTPRCLQLSENLVKEPRTLVVIGPYNSQRTIAVAPIFNAAHVNLVAATASAEKVWHSGPYVFSAADSTEKRVRALARYVVRKGYKKVAVLLDEGSRISHEMQQAFEEEVRPSHIETLELPSYTEDETRFVDQIDMIRRLKPDLIFMCEYRAMQTARLATALRRADITTPICAQTIPFTRELVELGGSNVDGLLLSAFFHPHMDTPRTRTFVALFHNKFGPLTTPTHLSLCTFDAFQAVCEALERNSTREDVNRFLRDAGTTSRPFEGIVGPFAMAQHLDARPIWIIEVKNGRYCLLEQALPPGGSTRPTPLPAVSSGSAH